LSFIAEKTAIREALASGFQEQYPQQEDENVIYYSRKPEDRIITFRESNDDIIRKIKAFNNISQGCEFFLNGRRFLVYAVTCMRNPFLIEYVGKFVEGMIALSYEGCVVFRKENEVLRFQNVISEDGTPLSVGESLF